MDHIDTLVKRLRAYSQSLVSYKLDADFADACTEAADALEKLQAENDKMRPFYTKADTHFKLWEKTAMDAYEERNRAKAELEKLQAKLDRVTLERDAAVDDLRVASIEGDMECNWCAGKTDRTQCYNCSFANKWKWSGTMDG